MKFLNKNQVKFSPASFFVLRKQDLGWKAFPKEICEANLPKPAKIKSFLIEKFLSPVLIKIKILLALVVGVSRLFGNAGWDCRPVGDNQISASGFCAK